MTNGSNMNALGLVSLEEAKFDSYERRRLKAAVALTLIWTCTAILHLLAWGQWIVYGLTLLTGAHLCRVLLAQPDSLPAPLPSWRERSTVDAVQPDWSEWPYVSILVAAKNEVAVIGQLAQSLMDIDYPPHRYDVWLIDDNSNDGTSERLDELAQHYVNLNVIHRDRTATGGKSGALNQVWQKTEGSLLAVFDADAQIAPDCLRRIVPVFATTTVGAVQMRKAITNGDQNFWTRGQVAEMAFDAYCQLKRVTSAGIGELRGNGQFVRRTAIKQCGGWNEETITDDLDLTFRLHLTDWDVALVMTPAVFEEGVEGVIGLWHQRNRWAEGGYQRYLDYWHRLNPSHLGWPKTLDLFAFFLIQYLLPMVAIPDFALAVARNRLPVFLPLSSLMVVFASLGMANGLRQTQRISPLTALLQTLRGMIYMTHWMLVISTVAIRIAIRPKRLKWVKTQHSGFDENDDTLFEASVSPR